MVWIACSSRALPSSSGILVSIPDDGTTAQSVYGVNSALLRQITPRPVVHSDRSGTCPRTRLNSIKPILQRPHFFTSLSLLQLHLTCSLLRAFSKPFSTFQVTMFAKLSFSAASAAAVASVMFLLAGYGTGVSASPVQGIDVPITVCQAYNLLLLPSQLTSIGPPNQHHQRSRPPRRSLP